MDRRRVLKNMGLSLGYVVATPTLLSIVQSCKKEATATWVPVFFTPAEGVVITKLVDIILPKTDSPSASEVNAHMFIDTFADEVMEKDQQDFVKMAMGKFMDKALKNTGKENIEDLTAEELESVLSNALKHSKDKQAEMFEAITAYTDALKEGKSAVLDDEIANFSFANNLRGMTIWGYKASEVIGEEYLAYLPVPGEYIACGDVQELTGGKAWSL